MATGQTLVTKARLKTLASGLSQRLAPAYGPASRTEPAIAPSVGARPQPRAQSCSGLGVIDGDGLQELDVQTNRQLEGRHDVVE